MSRLQCIGTSSKVPSQASEAVKPGILSPRDAPVNKSVQSKTQPQKPKLSTRPEGQQPSVITERRRDKGNVDRITVDTELVSETQSAQQQSGFKETDVKHRSSRSKTHAGLQALSPAGTTTPRQEKSATHSSPASAEQKTVSGACTQEMHEPVVLVPPYLGVPKCGTGGNPIKAESGDEEECGEEDEDTAEFDAPIELLAEFLKALMERKYTLAKKLCQMILIYEPENLEAKHFLPLIEERLLKEEAQEGSSSEHNTSDDDDDGDDDDGDDDDDESSSSSGGSGDDDDDDDDDTDTGTDSDGDSCSSSSDREEEDISQR